MKPGGTSSKDQTTSPLVVKVGGSLFNRIPDIIPVLNASKRPLLLIPGGGPFADLVRHVQVDNDTAHWMAISAMEQYGWFIASFGISTTDMIATPLKTTVFLPYQYLRLNDVLPHTWDVTSDTIAAWVAETLHLDLLLLKSVDGIFINGIFQKQVTGPVESDVIDPFFIPLVIKKSVKTTIINGSQPDRVEKFLKGDLVLRTEIGTTF
ncbi:MAG TPA: uridylate kinase [Methanoregula sp.]|nr:uridylate kinase [Methanoregula sp.]